MIGPRRAFQIPLPGRAPLERLARPRQDRDGLVVGVHCKSLRAGMDPLPVVEVLAEALRPVGGARLRVDVHTDVMTAGTARHDARLSRRVRRLAAEGSLELVVHDYFTDDELFDYLAALDVSVLPYRFGTHSGWPAHGPLVPRWRKSVGAMMSFTLPSPTCAANTNSSSAASSPTARQPADRFLPWIMMSPPRSLRPSLAAILRSNALG